jgi:hypothetical protein
MGSVTPGPLLGHHVPGAMNDGSSDPLDDLQRPGGNTRPHFNKIQQLVDCQEKYSVQRVQLNARLFSLSHPLGLATTTLL